MNHLTRNRHSPLILTDRPEDRSLPSHGLRKTLLRQGSGQIQHQLDHLRLGDHDTGLANGGEGGAEGNHEVISTA